MYCESTTLDKIVIIFLTLILFADKENFKFMISSDNFIITIRMNRY